VLGPFLITVLLN